MDGEPDGVVAGLAEAQLEERADRAGHLHAPERRRGVADERGVGGVGGHADRAGVRDAHRDAVRVDDEGDAEPHDELAHGLDDALPLVVRLGAGQQVVRLAVAVGEAVQQHRRVVVLDPPVGVEDHGGAAAAVVEQLVDVEGGDDLGVTGLEQVTAEDRLDVPGVDEGAEGHDEHAGPGRTQVGVGLEAVERGGVLHGTAFHGWSSYPLNARRPPRDSRHGLDSVRLHARFLRRLRPQNRP